VFEQRRRYLKEKGAERVEENRGGKPEVDGGKDKTGGSKLGGG
jgi:hypothetical protein